MAIFVVSQKELFRALIISLVYEIGYILSDSKNISI